MTRGHRWWRRVSEPVAAYVAAPLLAIVAFVVALGGHLGRLALPLGGEDILQAYNVARLWSSGAWFGDTTMGFPFGMDLRYYPTADVVQNGLGGLLTWLTGDPFLGMNLVFAASFPAVALAALWVIRLSGLRGPMSVLAAVGFVTIPFHWLRAEHIYLATLYSAVLGVGLAILVGTGEVERRLRAWRQPRSVLPLAALVLVIALSGIYYVCFTVLLCAAALVYRWVRGAAWRSLLRDVVVVGALVVLLAAALAPAFLFERSNPPLDAVADRRPAESVTYAGSLALALVPNPSSRVPGVAPLSELLGAAFREPGTSGVIWPSNYGSLFTTAALLFAVFAILLRIRRSALGRAPRVPARPPMPGVPQAGLVGALIVVSLLFFIPWGLNALFASAVTPQLRGWDRLLPVLFLLVTVLAAVTWRTTGLPEGGRRAAVVAGLGLVVVFADAVLPYRATFTTLAGVGGRWSVAGEDYAAALNAAVPGDCGVLQLPYMAYPEVPALEGLVTYGHYWPALTNPEKRWSYAAMKGTLASAWQEELGADVDARVVGYLADAGFCAIHVDMAGFTADDGAALVDDLTALLGAPVATGNDGTWLAFRVPDPAPPGSLDADTILDARDDAEQTFYFPPTITPTDGAAILADDRAERWWVDDQAWFAVRAIRDRADFRTVAGSLVAPACGDRRVEVTLTSGGASDRTVLDVPADGAAEFGLTLDAPVTQATLEVRPLGAGCAGPDGEPGHLILADPVARS